MQTTVDIRELQERIERESSFIDALTIGEKYYVNLKEINALWLRRAGVENIEISDACTSCQHDRFWSHRVTRGQRGSQGAIILCKEAGR